MRSPWRFAMGLLIACMLVVAAAAQQPAEPEGESAPRVEEPATPPTEPPPAATDADSRQSICLMVEAAARAHGLPVEFFARIIWQESRFQADAVGPRTRSGARAQGIAQFMPATAAERGLLDPFNPILALPKSAEFLRELRDQFGNLGLAAAAYNAGPQRLRDFLAGVRTLPSETRNYVLAVTGSPVEDWVKSAKGEPAKPPPSGTNCSALIALLRRAPNPFVEKLEERVKVVAASPWGVQLSAGFSRDHALAAFARTASRYGNLLAGHDPSILSTTLRSRGTRAFYQVRLGANTRAEADGLCGKIRQAGGACLVLRNSGKEG